MENKKDNIARIESISTIIVNIGTIVSWALTIFTAYVLTSQPQPISLPGVLELNTAYKLLFLVSAFLGYLQLLKRNWENQKRSSKEVESNFASYLYGGVIKLKRPLVFIGFLIILSIIAIVIFTELIGLGVAIIIIGIATAATIFFSNEPYAERIKWRYDDEFRKRWLKRIKKQLYDDGYATTVDFQNLPMGYDEINWAIKLYFEIYEFEQDLILSQRFIEKKYRQYEICEVRFRHVKSRLDD